MEILDPPDYSTVNELFGLWKKIRMDLLSLLESVTDESLTAPSPGQWSLSEVMEHLYLSQLSVYLVIKKISREQPDPTTRTIDYRDVRKKTFEARNVKNPEAVSPGKNYPKMQILELLAKSENKLEALLLAADKENLRAHGFDHPLYGNMNLFDWIWVMALHELRHLKFMQERLG